MHTTKIKVTIELQYTGHKVNPQQIGRLVEAALEHERQESFLCSDTWLFDDEQQQTSCDHVALVSAEEV